ncbi:amino acid adenylation domain-containing protein [Bradyrhizobium sp. AUGA SZCCT0274]|uniref:non-ribosomal peptide synthetase n=1 Tax=Bradyrhizobium sp. AUGA SZCCT0274 TaxID=2807670 RepID=UPI001BA86FBB|nr:non-ribosomal peptide synthetase [Bradyrhizobium sp. AUGA SZCCT0274]MBR1240317.1 amino acid adenylation domain-containing protein [Bradyrhizobium sp. AUGA SZCCT0274]
MTDLVSSSAPYVSDAGGTFTVPASFSQERMIFFDRYRPGVPLYNIPMAWRIRGPLDVAALEKAFRQIADRHESLRTTFEVENGNRLQIIANRSTLSLETERLKSEVELEGRIVAFTSAEAERTFDLAAGPLVRARLGFTDEDDAVLIVTLHHVISDLASLAIFARELSALYEANVSGSPSGLPDLPIQYADYSEWQAERLGGPALDRLLTYWRGYTNGAPLTLSLPTDRPRSLGPPAYRGGWVEIEFGPALSAKLLALSARLGATFFMVMAAAFEIVLYRSTGQADFLLGYPVSGRDHPDIADLIGLFQNTLVLRTRLSPNMAFADVVRQVKEDVIAGQEHKDLPFERLVDELQPDRSVTRHPLFQAAITFAGSCEELDLHGLNVAPLTVGTKTSKFDVTLFVSDPGTPLTGGLEFDLDLFDKSTMERLAERLVTILRVAAELPHTTLSRLAVIGEREHRLLVEFSAPPAVAPLPKKCVHQQVGEQARFRPDAVAVVDASGCVSYGALTRRAAVMAGRLRALGVRTGQPVGLCVRRSADMVAAMLGILSAGGAYVPLDPQLPAARLAAMTFQMGLTVIVAAEPLTNRLQVSGVKEVVIDAAFWETGQAPETPDAATPDCPAYGIFTSGSTGEPKAVLISQRALMHLVAWHQAFHALGQDERVAQMASFSFDACTWDVWACLAAGATLIIVDDDTRNDPERLVGFLAAQRVSHAFVPTPLAEALLSTTRPWPDDLKVMLTGGDRLRRRPQPSVGFYLVNHYGPAECTVVASAGRVCADGHGLPTIGRPIGGTAIYVLDEALNRIPIGAPGELFIGGGTVGLGYWRRPGLTAECFLPDPFSAVAGGRMYRTGDLVRLRSDGEIEYLGRRDRQLKIRGQRLEPGEIETVLEGHSSVRRCFVEVRETDTGDKLLTAYVESDETSDVAPSIWREHLEKRLPGYMLPAAFIRLDRFPMLANGKPDYQALPNPSRGDVYSDVAFVAPRTPVERILADIWSEVLYIDDPGIHDNFFSLGGHSLAVLQVVARIGTEFGIDFTVRGFFESPTIAELGNVVEELLWLGSPERGGHPDDLGEVGEI